MPKPLDGIKVLDMTRVLAGPYCTMLLADMGADVVKVERPGAGDDTRGYGPPFLNGESAYFLSINRNKKAITLNFHLPSGQEIFRQLAQRADVILQNFRPGALDRWHIGYEDIRAVKPDIVYVSISCLGQWGPLSYKVGYDTDAQAMGGIMSITGQAEGPPTKTCHASVDYLTGVKAARPFHLVLHFVS